MRDNPGLPRVLLTRPRPASEAMARDLDGIAACCIAPLVEIVHLDAQVATGDARAIIVTSRHALPHLPRGVDLPLHVVGPEVGRLAREAGQRVETVARDADDLVAILSGADVAGPMVHLRGRHARGDIAARLAAAGIEIREQIVYSQDLLEPDETARRWLSDKVPLFVPLYSPRTARHFMAFAEGGAPLHILCMSDAIAATLSDLRDACEITVAARPDGAAMMQALKARISA